MHTISHAQRIAGYAGVAALVLSVYMSAAFGWQMSAAHALTLGIVSVMAAILWPIADAFRRDGSKGMANIIVAAAIVMISAEWFSHVGYTIGARVHNNDEARVVNAVHSEAQEAIVDDRKNLAMWREQLNKLQAEHAWAATVSADGLRASLGAASKAIDLETARGGCKSRCLTLMQDKAKLEERIAIAEKSTDLAKRIEATQRILDGKRDAGAKVEFKHSATVAQTSFVAKLVSQDLAPGESTKTWVEIAIGLFLATVSTMLPAIGAFVWFRERKHDTETVSEAPHAPIIRTQVVEKPTIVWDKAMSRAIADATRGLRGELKAA
jgi:hypothetical protein